MRRSSLVICERAEMVMFRCDHGWESMPLNGWAIRAIIWEKVLQDALFSRQSGLFKGALILWLFRLQMGTPREVQANMWEIAFLNFLLRLLELQKQHTFQQEVVVYGCVKVPFLYCIDGVEVKWDFMALFSLQSLKCKL